VIGCQCLPWKYGVAREVSAAYYNFALRFVYSAIVCNSELGIKLLEYALSLARDLAHSWPRGPYQYYLCATPPSGYDPYAFNPRTRYLIIYR
jgi:hypothetical protein